MCHKQLRKKPLELYRKGGVTQELQLTETEWPIQHCITELKKSAMVTTAIALMCLLHVKQIRKFSLKTSS